MLSKFKDVLVRNFQKHTRLRISFDDQITAIVGPTNTGKSSVIRAIAWLVFNRPTGTSFIRHGEDSCDVRLRTDDLSIRRVRDKKTNAYVQDGEKLKAIGSSIPESVQRSLRLSDLNFQFQHDAPFWFSLPATEVSKRLNEIVDLSTIDRSLNYCSNLVRRSRQAVEIHKEEIDRQTVKIKELNWTIEADAELAEIEKLEKRQSKVLNNFMDLDRLAAKLRDHKQTAEMDLPHFTAIDNLQSLKASKNQDIRILRDHITQLERAKQKIENSSETLDSLEKKFHAKFGKNICPLCKQKILS